MSTGAVRQYYSQCQRKVENEKKLMEEVGGGGERLLSKLPIAEYQCTNALKLFDLLRMLSSQGDI